MAKKVQQGKVEKALQDMGKAIDELIDKAKNSKGDIKVETDKRIKELKKDRDSLEEKYKNFKEGHAEDFEKFETYMQKSADEVKSTINNLFSKFKK